MTLEAVHPTTIDIRLEIESSVGSAIVDVARIMERFGAPTVPKVWKTNRRLTVEHRYAIGAGVGAEVVVKGTILLHDNHDVLDF